MNRNMSLLKINDTKAEQESLAEEEKSIAIGIDLGTSNSVVSCYIDNKVEVLTIDEESKLLPSIVSYQNNKTLVGVDAKKLIGKHTVLSSIKKIMGKSFGEIKPQDYNFNFASQQDNKTIRIEVDNKIVTPEEISSEILKVLKEKAEAKVGANINKAVITVPAYFDEGARVATKNAARLAGLEVLRLINEPTAAALAYGLDNSIEGIYVVYDLGGGTFDVSILKLDKGIFKVLATSGDTNLGGDDIDNLIYSKVLQKLPYNNLNGLEKSHLLSISKGIKEQFSTTSQVETEIELRDKKFIFSMTIGDFNLLINDIIKKTLNICKQALDDSAVDDDKIKGVVLVGGSTRILEIQKRVAQFFGVTPLCDINPDEVVAIGAGYQAAMLTGNSMDSLLLDVIPLSLGLEIAGGMVEKIIPRNSLIPIAKKQEFTTSKDGQTSMLIHVLQGEREMVEDLRSLGKFNLKGIPPMPAGIARIEVSFIVDADGLLRVEAQEKITQVKHEIEVKPSWGLDFEDMREMIEKSMINAEADINKRLLSSDKVDAKQLIAIVDKALQEDSSLITTLEVEDITTVLNNLKESIETEDRSLIAKLTSQLEKVTTKFAELRMTVKIKNILEGKSVDQVEKELKEK